jgi:hypothetical protein
MAKSAAEIFAELKATKHQVVVHGKTYTVVEGDVILDDAKLWAYAQELAQAAATPAADVPVQPPQSLVGITDKEGRKVRWKKGLVLTYTIKKSTFADEAQYKMAVDAMAKATADWEATCGVNFRHVVERDTQPEQAGEALFLVEGVKTGGRLIAAAFFPNDPAEERRVIIDAVFFSDNLKFDRTGVLRHELGHVLGFRHEHIRSGAPAVCPNEPLSQTIDLTAYDPQSVMHYFCGGVGDPELKITELDRQGSQSLYGPPDATVRYYE